MNLFRIVFLFITLTCGGLLALTQLAPPVFENETDRALTERAQAEARTLWRSEQLAALQRERLAAGIASSPALLAALEPPLGGAAVEASRLQSVFRAVADEALRGGHTPFTVLTMVGTDGTNQIPLPDRGVINIEELVSESLATEAMENRTNLHHAFSINGRLFLSIAVPVRGNSGNVLGAVLLVLEYNAAVAASRQSSTHAQIAYFAQLDIAADTISDDMLREPVLAFVRRVNEGRLGAPGEGGIPEDVRYRPADAAGIGSGSDRMAVMVPISLQIGNSARSTPMDFAAVVVVDDAWPPSTLLEYIVEGQGLEAGNLTFWTFLAVALALYFIALFIHDAFLGIALDRLGTAIEANAQSNSPHSIDASQHPAWLRSLISRVNILIEEFRSKSSVAKRAREEAEHIKEHVEAVTGAPAMIGPPRRQSDTGSVPTVPPVRRATNTGSLPAIPLYQRPETVTAEAAPVALAKPPEPPVASGALPTVMGHANTEVLPAITGPPDAEPHTSLSKALATPPASPEPPIRADEFDAESSSINKVAEAFLANQVRTPTPHDVGSVEGVAPPVAEEAPADIDGLFMTGDYSLPKIATIPDVSSPNPSDSSLNLAARASVVVPDASAAAQRLVHVGSSTDTGEFERTTVAPTLSSMATIPDEARRNTARNQAVQSEPTSEFAPRTGTVPVVRPSLAPPSVRPMVPRATQRTPAASLVTTETATSTEPMRALTDEQLRSGNVPAVPAVPAAATPDKTSASSSEPTTQRGRATVTTDIAGQPVASTTESSGVSQLINSIMIDRPTSAEAAVPRPHTGSWQPARPEDSNAITSPPPAFVIPPPPTGSVAASVSSLGAAASGVSSLGISIAGVSSLSAASAPAESLELPEPPDQDDRGEELSDDMLAALDAMSHMQAPRTGPARRPEPNAQTQPPVMPVPPAQTQPPGMPPAPAGRAEAPSMFQKSPEVTNTDALFNRAEEQMRKLSTTSEETFVLYGEFIAARRKCGESTSELTFEKFTQKLERSRDQLKERYHTTRIDFSVDIVENRATLKARPHRSE